jgi:hypothetical protein
VTGRPARVDVHEGLARSSHVRAIARSISGGVTGNAPHRPTAGDARMTSYDVGIGPGNSCSPASLGTASVNRFGMNTGGAVDGNDKFYVAFHCAGAPGDAGPTSSICPAGKLVTAVNGNETIQCASASAAIERYARQHCFVYAGWRDSCNACTTAPAVGRVGQHDLRERRWHQRRAPTQRSAPNRCGSSEAEYRGHGGRR